MRAVVVALGKIGLPVAVKLALAGHEVIGCDADGRVVELVNQAREPFPGEPGLREALETVVPAGALRATTDTPAAVAEDPSLVIAVPPLMVDREARPDFTILDAVLADIGQGLRAGTVVCVETTLPVGTTRDAWRHCWRSDPGCAPRRTSSASTVPNASTRDGCSPTSMRIRS